MPELEEKSRGVFCLTIDPSPWGYRWRNIWILPFNDMCMVYPSVLKIRNLKSKTISNTFWRVRNIKYWWATSSRGRDSYLDLRFVPPRLWSALHGFFRLLSNGCMEWNYYGLFHVQYSFIMCSDLNDPSIGRVCSIWVRVYRIYQFMSLSRTCKTDMISNWVL